MRQVLSLFSFWNSMEFSFHQTKPWKGLDKLLLYPGSGHIHFSCVIHN